jgi:hypothetical protein
MLRRFFATAGIIVWSGCSWAAAAASAQDVASPLANAMPKLTFATSVTAPAAAPVAAEETSSFASRPSIHFGSSGDKALMPFYASTAVMQFLDVRSTLEVVKLGGGEGNPLLKGMVAHPAMFVGFKAAIAAASIYSAHKMAAHNKLGAIATMVALNSVYAFVVQHNFALAQTMRK